MAAPRTRQLRRDKLLFTLALHTVRLHLEEAGRLARQPELREAPDADLQLIQQSIDQWVNLSVGYIMRKHRCPLKLALELVGVLQAELRQSIPADELWQVPLGAALLLPPELQASPSAEAAG